MNSIEIAGNGYHYTAQIGPGLIARAGELLGTIFSKRRCAVIADENASHLFWEKLRRGLAAAGFEPELLSIPAGEHAKHLETVAEICERMAAAGFDRDSLVIGLGGGVTGDISGFVAAIFHRGISHVQIPTTLLAMLDSAIGGKTGVNLRSGKNLVGAIHHPSLVIIDIEALETLPAREMRQGFAEIIKHAVIADADMFNQLSCRASVERSRRGRSSVAPMKVCRSKTHAGRISSAALQLDFTRDELTTLIGRNIAIKARIIATDERDIRGQRALLNFGHTVGHGIERATDFEIAHGDCVSLGMVAACRISGQRAGLTVHEQQEIIDLLAKFDLPTHLPAGVDREEVLGAILRDKKFQAGQIRFVVARAIGHAELSRNVTMDDIREAVMAL